MGFLIALQFMIALLFYPIRIGAKGHASLAYDKVDLDMTLLRIPIARLRIKRREGLFKIALNGRELAGDKKISFRQFKSVCEQYRIEGIKMRGSLSALIGTQDAKTTAIMGAVFYSVLQPIIKELKIFAARPTDTLEIDGRIGIKINTLQIIGLVTAGLRGKNG